MAARGVVGARESVIEELPEPVTVRTAGDFGPADGRKRQHPPPGRLVNQGVRGILRSAFLENLGLKAMSLAFALGFYAFIHGAENAQRTVGNTGAKEGQK